MNSYQSDYDSCLKCGTIVNSNIRKYPTCGSKINGSQKKSKGLPSFESPEFFSDIQVFDDITRFELNRRSFKKNLKF
ncbi:MAG: hypothetical protein ACFFAU_09675 [Candidatus Hodarchaeota archaeon]